MLKTELEGGRRALATRKDGLKMFHRLQQRVRLRTGRGWLLAAQPGAKQVQFPAQFPPQSIDRFQGERQPQFLRRGLERSARQQPDQQLPKQRSRDGVARQNLCQQDGECPPASTAPAAIGAEHPLAPESLAGRRQGIIAAQEAVPVQCADSFAVRARPLLERKSCVFKSRSSRTKQKSECDIRPCCLSMARSVELFLTALPTACLGCMRSWQRKGRHWTALCPH